VRKNDVDHMDEMSARLRLSTRDLHTSQPPHLRTDFFRQPYNMLT
jgi:hypothetical protein